MKLNEYIDFDIFFMTVVFLLALQYFKEDKSQFVIQYEK